jgi:hypothetical protein
VNGLLAEVVLVEAEGVSYAIRLPTVGGAPLLPAQIDASSGDAVNISSAEGHCRRRHEALLTAGSTVPIFGLIEQHAAVDAGGQAREL